MRNGKLFELIREMSDGKRVIAVFGDMHRAAHAFGEVRRKCAEHGILCEVRKTNGRSMLIKSGDGSIRLTSERAELRGCSCDVFYRDYGVTIRDWMVPLIMQAQELYGVEL